MQATRLILKLELLNLPKLTATGPGASEFDINEANVRLWRRGKESLKKQRRDSKASGQGKKAAHPLLEEKLVEYISNVEQVGVLSELLKFACTHEGNGSSISIQSIAKMVLFFMKRHDISIRRRTSIAQLMPDDFERKLLDYQRFILRLCKRHVYAYGDGLITNADQTPLTFNIPFTQTMAHKDEKSITLKSTGNEKNRFMVMLGTYGDGTKMPPYITFKRKTLPKKWDLASRSHCPPTRQGMDGRETNKRLVETSLVQRSDSAT